MRVGALGTDGERSGVSHEIEAEDLDTGEAGGGTEGVPEAVAGAEWRAAVVEGDSGGAGDDGDGAGVPAGVHAEHGVPD